MRTESGSGRERALHGRARAALAALSILAGTLAGVAPAAAQDVEMLGRMYGTSPPPEYFALRAADQSAFEYQRALFRRLPGTGPPGGSPGPGPEGARRGAAERLLRAARVLGPPSGVVAGRFEVPVVLGLYADSPAEPHSRDAIQAHFFDGPNPTGTIRDYYAEASGGLVDLAGVALDWRRASLTAEQVAGGSSGLGGSSRVGEFIVEIVTQLDSTGIDWGAFDNDGPDGVPNSGDDDGFVDILAVLHPTPGAECVGNRDSDRIWSHRWAIAPQMGSPFVTSTASPSAGNVMVNDYIVQPAVSCAGGALNQIGVFTHELGHGFGLPDLYAVGGDHAAAGQWDLMGTGSWGCPGVFDPSRPCQMGAWTKSVLGWVSDVELDRGRDFGVLRIPPVMTSRSAYRIGRDDGESDYYLIENRQRLGFDGELPEPGLLVWQIDVDVVAERWPSNTVNSSANRQGVRLVQADGRDQLSVAGGGRGDSGDPFPGTSGRTDLHAGTDPATYWSDGRSAGVTALDIRTVGLEMWLRLLTRYQTLRLEAPGTSGAGLFRVDGASPVPPGTGLSSAPFETHVIEALEGDPVADGVRSPFQSWSDGAPRTRSQQTGLGDETFSASYAGREVELRITHRAERQTVAPGQLVLDPPGPSTWVSEAATVTVEAQARTGFRFREWTGDLAGMGNPVTLVMNAPVTADAVYDVTFGLIEPPARIELEGGVPADVVFQIENGTLPALWSLLVGNLPEGLELGPDGHIRGTPLDRGEFPVRVGVVDAIGLAGSADVRLAVGPPTTPARVLAGPFLGSGEGPTLGQAEYLDRQGNRNGRYDLGDFRAFVVAGQSGGGPAGSDVPTDADGAIRVEVPAIRVGRGGPPGGGSGS